MLEPVMTVLSEKEVTAMTEPAAPAARVWRARLLDYLDGHAADMVADLAGLVRVPSISGTAEENAIQDVLSARLAGDAGLAHAPRESVPIGDLLTAARALTLIALEHCGVR